jgi:hypothetical protein
VSSLPSDGDRWYEPRGVARSGKAGFEVMPTFPNPAHYSVILPDGAPTTLDALRACFYDPEPNLGYEPDR